VRFSVTGLNHKTAPVAVRERVAFPDAQLPESLEALRAQPGVQEALILSTCNRVEVALAAEDQTNLRDHVERFLASSHQIDPGEIGPHLYHFEAGEAVRHLFRVASSLDSMVVGEPQILGQLKAAYQIARTQGSVHSLLDSIVARAFNVAKRVRTETEIGQNAASISLAAVELARDIFGSLKHRRVMIIGAGEMAEQALRHLRRQGIAELLVANRTLSRAQELAAAFGGRAVEYLDFLHTLPEVDIVIASSAAPHFLITPAEMRRVIELRRNRPVFLIDIAVPRNIDPAVQQLDHVFLYDVDDLQQVVSNNLKVRQSEADQAERIITEEVERVGQWLKTREAGPLIKALQDQLEATRQAEFERLRSRLNGLTPQQAEAVEALTRGLVAKLAHGPLVELRRAAAQPDEPAALELIKRMFRLEDR
jgi:glutamyl-tRNA reductase